MCCPRCGTEMVFHDVAVDTSGDEARMRDEFTCPRCRAALTKREVTRATSANFDPLLRQTVTQTRRLPVLIRYLVGSKHHEKKPDADDLALLQSVRLDGVSPPIVAFPEGGLSGGNRRSGLTHLHHYYTPRNLLTLSRMMRSARGPWQRQLWFLIQSVSMRL